jgi:hypothetical protein
MKKYASKKIPRIVDTDSRLLSVLAILGVADSPYPQNTDSIGPLNPRNLFNFFVAF